MLMPKAKVFRGLGERATRAARDLVFRVCFYLAFDDEPEATVEPLAHSKPPRHALLGHVRKVRANVHVDLM